MKTSSSGKNSTAQSLNSKSKKSSKDREKRKSSSGPEKIEQLSNDKGSPNKDGSLRKYAGIGPDSILIYSEQSTFEHLSDEVTYGLAEDLSYKLRYVIHDALIKARLSGRNHILASDVEATFEDLNIDKVYGATSTPNWIAFGEQSLYYLDDPVVNLVELAEQECSYVQPGVVTMTRKWLPDTKEVSKPLKNYFETMCLAVVSDDVEVRKFALKNIGENNLIGPVVEWFYHFGYFLLSKDITYDCLTLSALNLIRVLERSHVALLIVSEKQLKLLVRLILQRLLRSAITMEVLKPMCHVLAVLCDRIPIRELVTIKVSQKIARIEESFVLPIVSILNALGVDAISEIFVPNMDYFLHCAEQRSNPEFVFAVLQTYSILCRHFCGDMRQVDEGFYRVFGDSLCAVWKRDVQINTDFCKSEMNWLNVKSQLLKTRRKMHFSYANGKNTTKVFPEYDDSDQEELEEKLEHPFVACGCNLRTGSKGKPDAWFTTTLRSDMEIYKPVFDFEEFEAQLEKPVVSFKVRSVSRVRPDPLVSVLNNELDSYKPEQLVSILTSEFDSFNPEQCHPSINFLSDIIGSKPKFVTVGRRSLLIPALKGYKDKTNLYNKHCDHSLMFFNL